MSSRRARLRSLVRSPQSGRVRAVWRVLVPVLAGFLTLLLVSATAFRLGLNGGQAMVAGFAGTTLVLAAVLVLSARYVDRRPIREYGYHLSRGWWLDLAAGTGIGTLLVAATFVLARATGALRVTSGGPVTDPSTLGWLLVFFVAFVGVAFYEEYLYRGAFVTNAVEGLTARGVTRSAAVPLALVASTLAFALVHLPGALAGGADVALVAVKTGLLGGLLGVAYVWTDELALPMGLHLGVNYALMNVFGIGAAKVPGIPALLTVEHTATGLWSPARGVPLFVSILVGYGLVAVWVRWRGRDRTVQQRTRSTHSHSDR
ncbi:CPBP family intramembrane glutamic endopeptidase [Haloarcula litorea]|uniref:CPBP family intramembrane glutamic endopeptidase n=1 Tax=Haloarcula litorea TaxID=3032579 RepID=UPI0023E860DF|nr:CPBP family intramembrane glutamic endopeptidase [Halomicroarcula sp. GDY20]